MTSRTNCHTEGRNLSSPDAGTSSDLQHRRQLAVERYLDGDPIEVICQEMGCAKSWLYKWKHRYQATDPAWSQERSRRPATTPAKTPEANELPRSKLRGIKPPFAYTRVPPVWRGDTRVACEP